MVFLHNLVAVGLWLGLSSAQLELLTDPIPPSQDPWYAAPCGFENEKPGTILRTRHAPGNLTLVITNSSEAYNLLYRTTDTNDQPSWAVTTLFLPNVTTSACSSGKLLSYQSAYDSVNLDASPSHGLYNALSSPDILGIPPDSLSISRALGYGWHVTVPDYEGPLASFGEGAQAGHAVLDGIKASLSFLEALGFSDMQSAIWGYSGGAIATGWAAEIQPQYAAELKLSGAAVGGLPSGVEEIVSNINETPFVGLLFSAVLGVVSQFPAANKSLAAALRTEGPYNITGFYAAKQRDVVGNFIAYAGQDIAQYTVDDLVPTELPATKDLMRSEFVLGQRGVPQVAYFAYASVLDRVAGITTTDALMNKYCEEGAGILYQRNTAGGHIAEITNGVDRAFDFLTAVFAGTYSLDGCRTENVTVAINPNPDPI